MQQLPILSPLKHFSRTVPVLSFRFVIPLTLTITITAPSVHQSRSLGLRLLLTGPIKEIFQKIYNYCNPDNPFH